MLILTNRTSICSGLKSVLDSGVQKCFIFSTWFLQVMVRELEAGLSRVRMDVGSPVGSKRSPPCSYVTDPFFPALITCVKHIYGLCICSPSHDNHRTPYARKQKRSCRCANCLRCHRPSLTFDDPPITGLHTMVTTSLIFVRNGSQTRPAIVAPNTSHDTVEKALQKTETRVEHQTQL